jgi:glutamate-1-semialdehyde 2,1-aminomutase
MCAGLAIQDLLQKEEVYEELEQKAHFLLAPIQDYLSKRSLPVQLAHIGSCFCFFFSSRPVHTLFDLQQTDRACFQEFFHFLLQRGIFIPPSQEEVCFISLAHSLEHLKETSKAIIDFFESKF